MSRKGLIFIISAPSGTGKTTVLKKVLERRSELICSVSATTRAPRPGERDGKDYLFISDEEFRKGIEAGKFAEWADVHGHLYGTPEEFLESQRKLGNDVVLDIDPQGALQVKNRHPEAVLIFLMPPSFEELERRLRGRKTESDDTVKRRLTVAIKEMEQRDFYDHVIFNSEIERTADEIETVIDRETVSHS